MTGRYGLISRPNSQKVLRPQVRPVREKAHSPLCLSVGKLCRTVPASRERTGPGFIRIDLWGWDSCNCAVLSRPARPAVAGINGPSLWEGGDKHKKLCRTVPASTERTLNTCNSAVLSRPAENGRSGIYWAGLLEERCKPVNMPYCPGQW